MVTVSSPPERKASLSPAWGRKRAAGMAGGDIPRLALEFLPEIDHAIAQRLCLLPGGMPGIGRLRGDKRTGTPEAGITRLG